jgi:Restriction endonuclease
VGNLADLLARLHSDAGVHGQQFEHITKWFLTNSPLYRNELRRVWLWDEWPGRWAADAGIDLLWPVLFEPTSPRAIANRVLGIGWMPIGLALCDLRQTLSDFSLTSGEYEVMDGHEVAWTTGNTAPLS